MRARRCRAASRKWRPEPESNRRARICSPLRNHSAIGPPRAKWAGSAWLSTGLRLVWQAMQAAAALILGALRPILDFALPPRCPGCGAIVEQPHRFCLGCWSSLTFLGAPCCARCALPFDYGEELDVICGNCLAAPPAYDRLRAAVAYGAISRAVALRLKYHGRPGVAETMARFMERHLDPAGEPLLAPVPLHRWRLWRRGYNQAALIAGALARRAQLEARLDLVDRVKATPVLRGMSPRERKEAVRGAFRIDPRRKPAVKGRR